MPGTRLPFRKARWLLAAGAAAVLGATALVGTVGSAEGQTPARYGGGIAVNIAADTMVSRATQACPDTPNPNCQRQPGMSVDGTLVGGEGAFFAPLDIPTGAKMVRVEIIGTNTDHSNLADPALTLRETKPIGVTRAVAIATLDEGLRRQAAGVLGSDLVRPDRAYSLRLEIPRTGSGEVGIQMLRVLYRPRAR